MVLKGQYIRTSYNNSFSENISLWEGVVVLRRHYVQAERASSGHGFSTEYFTLGGCCGPERHSV